MRSWWAMRRGGTEVLLRRLWTAQADDPRTRQLVGFELGVIADRRSTDDDAIAQ